MKSSKVKFHNEVIVYDTCKIFWTTSELLKSSKIKFNNDTSDTYDTYDTYDNDTSDTYNTCKNFLNYLINFWCFTFFHKWNVLKI